MVPAGAAAHVVSFVSWLVALGWLWQAVTSLPGLARLPDLARSDASLPPLPPGDGPHITVIVPARNEDAAIEATLRSLLASTGPRLQIIAVDDRSSDRTGERMDAIAAETAAGGCPHTLKVLHVRELPAGWLGKPHAMALAAQQATSPWLLFTDGDVLFHPHALELALREALATHADHLVLVPSLILRTTGERAMLAAMQVLAQWTVRLWKVADPRARDFIGVGGFNLIRREVYTQMGGFEALRMEVLDDLRLGWRVKRGGFQQRVAIGAGLVRIRWINGPLAVVRLVEKNGFAIYRFRIGLTLAAALAIAVQAVWPLLAMVAGGWSLVAGLVTYLGIALVYVANRRVTQVSPWMAVFFAPAAALVTFAFVRSMVLALLRNGVDWRGTRYSLAELRRNAGSEW
ncbi:MAG: glycosyltransferase [Acidobacteriota bacterium]|nr:glycosyltransferase [Acidobacteriota bacterium]